jgi:hypothetical protein
MVSGEMGEGFNDVCEVCGNAPAISIKLQSASSRIIWWNHTKINKPLCPGCAEMMYLKMQERTLTQGWWGPLSALATVVFSIGNRIRIGNHRKSLPTMATGNGSVERFRLQVRKRPAAVVLSLIAVFVIFALASNAMNTPTAVDTSIPTSYVGSCWSEASGGNQLQQVQCSDSSVRYTVSQVTDVAQNCPDVYIKAGNQYACMQRKM